MQVERGHFSDYVLMLWRSAKFRRRACRPATLTSFRRRPTPLLIGGLCRGRIVVLKCRTEINMCPA